MECFENKGISPLQHELQLKNMKQMKNSIKYTSISKEVTIMKKKKKENQKPMMYCARVEKWEET